MRRITFASLIALALALASVAPTLANGGQGPHANVWGSVDKSSHDKLDGTFTVPDGSQGGELLTLVGSTDGSSWQPTGQTNYVKVVKGQTSYGFSFDIDSGSHHYAFYKVDGNGWESRKFNRDECGFRVPEAPASPLLLLGAFPAGGLIALKATGVRLPLPHLHRIA